MQNRKHAFLSFARSLTALLLGAVLVGGTLLPLLAQAQIPQNVVSQPCETCSPTDVRLVDLDNDGMLDVLSVSEDDLTVAWFQGTGGGTFGPLQVIFNDWASFKTGSNNARPTFVTTGDLDGDGLPDVIAVDNAQSSGNGSIVWFENTTDGSGAAFGGVNVITETLRKPEEVVALDFDGDNDVDLVATSSLSPDVVTWFSNDGSGTFTRETDIATDLGNANALDVADVSGDGDFDLLVGAQGSDAIYFIENLTDDNGTESYDSPEAFTATGMIPTDVEIISLDGSNNLDFVVADRGNDGIFWYKGKGGGNPSFESRAQLASVNDLRDMEIADINADGELDIIVQDETPDAVQWLENDKMVFTAQTIAPDVRGREALAVGDIGGDARPDVVFAIEGDDAISSVENQTATGTWLAPQPVSTPPDLTSISDGVAIDLDGDAWDDFVIAADRLVWYRNQQDGTFSNLRSIDSSTNSGGFFLANAFRVRGADMDQDGDNDLVISSLNSVAWYENRLNETTNDFAAAQTIDGATDRVLDLQLADLDGDTYPDVVTTDYDDNEVSWYENQLDQATPGFGAEILLASGTFEANGAWNLDVDDIDQDGDLDVAFGSQFTDNVAWLENRLNETTNDFAALRTIGTINSNYGAWTGDFDGDGLPDVLSRASGGADLTIYTNQLDNTSTADFSTPTEVVSSLNSETMAVGDVNADNADDIIYINNLPNVNLSEVYSIIAEPGQTATGFGSPALVTEDVNNVRKVGLADFNQDGLTDVFTVSTNDSKVAWYANTNGVLPVELSAFTGRVSDDRVALSWTTASETNNAGFAIERREDDGAFAEIGFVAGVGTSAEAQSYQFTDRAVPLEADAVIYRLRQVDLDGTISYSSPITVQLALPAQAILHPVAPNPVRSAATLRVSLPQAADMSIAVYDLMGRRVATVVRGYVQEGRMAFPLNVDALASGTYFVRMVAGSAVRTQRLVVVR